MLYITHFNMCISKTICHNCQGQPEEKDEITTTYFFSFQRVEGTNPSIKSMSIWPAKKKMKRERTIYIQNIPFCHKLVQLFRGRISLSEQNFVERNLEINKKNLAQQHHVKVGGTNNYLDAQVITSFVCPQILRHLRKSHRNKTIRVNMQHILWKSKWKSKLIQVLYYYSVT